MRSHILALSIAIGLVSQVPSNVFAQETEAQETPAVVQEATPTEATAEEPGSAEAADPAQTIDNGAATTPTPTSVVGTPPEGKALVVFFRPVRSLGGALTFTVRESNTDLGRLGNGRYFVHVAEPGIHEYVVGRNDSLRIEVEPGEIYYIQQNIGMGLITWSALFEPSNQAAFDAVGRSLRRWEPRN